MKVRLIAMTGLLFAAFTMTALPVWAGDHGAVCSKSGHSCCQHKSQSCCKGGDKQGKPGLSDKFFHKAHFILEHTKDLSLSETQIQQIKQLKMGVKKTMIQSEADIDLLMLDIGERMKEYPTNTEALAGLIDQKYEIKRAKARSFAEAYAQLKNGLSEEQHTALKNIWAEKQGKKSCCSKH